MLFLIIALIIEVSKLKKTIKNQKDICEESNISGCAYINCDGILSISITDHDREKIYTSYFSKEKSLEVAAAVISNSKVKIISQTIVTIAD
jgi:general stress protein 26